MDAARRVEAVVAGDDEAEPHFTPGEPARFDRVWKHDLTVAAVLGDVSHGAQLLDEVLTRHRVPGYETGVGLRDGAMNFIFSCMWIVLFGSFSYET